jgi:hypothetical protein
MIRAGKIEEFAIDVEITGLTAGWIHGRIRFWFHKQVCGDWEDTVDIRGSYSWLKDFGDFPKNRFEPGLLEMSPFEVFEVLVRSVISEGPNQPRREEVFQQTMERFHIDHLAQSSFDQVFIVLIEDNEVQRCLWQQQRGEIHDDHFPAGHMQQVARDVCKQLEKEVAALGTAFEPPQKR